MTKNKPNKVKYKGVVYDINRGHWEVLSVFEWLMYGELDEIDQAIMLVTIILGEDAPVEQPLVSLAESVIKVYDEKKINSIKTQPSKQDMCFIRDYNIYRADIIREYGIDIAKENMDFDTLVSLLENLSHKSRLNQVREIRNKDLSKIKDIKERKAYREAQEYYRLEELAITQEDKVNQELEKELQEKAENIAELFI